VDPRECLLDIGSGHGRLVDYLGKKGFKHVIGLESNFRYLDKNQSNVVCGKGEQAPFKDKSFGAIFSIGLLSYIRENSKRKQLVNEIYRTLRPHGFLFMSCFVISDDRYHQKKYREAQIEFKEYGIFESDSGGIFRHSKENELRALLNNFDIINWKRRQFITMNKRKASGVIIEAQRR
jgi:SAM-dependent methyltransferase